MALNVGDTVTVGSLFGGGLGGILGAAGQVANAGGQIISAFGGGAGGGGSMNTLASRLRRDGLMGRGNFKKKKPSMSDIFQQYMAQQNQEPFSPT